ncbi:hypothetical protein [Haloferula rosea]|uniref:Uncharacterized protein n=1 Tax=Haloferula rosea TaxID=490093 RepID=A0A934RAC3_9BACT|nr:hypothetical protein [Haloferula rosea]MBK1827347.1 hypothetical protein [Haloferula rosea]
MTTDDPIATSSDPAERPGITEGKKFSEFLKTWITKLEDDEITMREAYESLMSIGNSQDEVPLIVKLTENPKFHFGGLGFFKGRVTLEQHDYIHILLGRGLTLMDEAFVIGFTMGSTDRVSSHEQSLFGFINKVLYPKPYRFKEDGMKVFKDAVALAYVSDCLPLEEVDFKPMLDMPLREIRKAVNLEVDLLQAYYRIEARRYPECAASQRLIE